MITLNYKTNNPRWGLSGIEFQNWESYSFILGYLSNPQHYKNLYQKSSRATVFVHIERNDRQGAWNKEGRIHYYDSLNNLRSHFYDLYACSSAGVGNIVRRINSNGYILSLIEDFNFEIYTYSDHETADVFPPEINVVEDCLKLYLTTMSFTNSNIKKCLGNFYNGYDF